MKSKCSFILKASTALVLALLMLFGTVTTSIAAVVDNTASNADEAARTVFNGGEDLLTVFNRNINNAVIAMTSNASVEEETPKAEEEAAEPESQDGEFFTKVRNQVDLADTGKSADLAETGASNPVKGGYLIVQKPTGWSDVSLVAGGSWGYDNNFTKGFHGTNISGTDYYYISLSEVGNSSASTAGGWYLVDGNCTVNYWGTSNWYVTVASGYTNRTGEQTYGFNANQYYLAVVTGTGSSCSVTTTAAAGGKDYSKTIADNTSHRYTQTVKVAIKAVGASSYTTKTSSNTTTGGTVKLTGKQWDAWNTTKDASSTASNYSSALSNAVKTSYVTLTTTNYTGYTLQGWYSTNATTGTNYTPSSGYKVSSAATTYALYNETQRTVTIKCGAGGQTSTTSTSSGLSTADKTVNPGVTTTKNIYAVPNAGYIFTGWTVTSGTSGDVTFGNASSASTTVKTKSDVTITANFSESSKTLYVGTMVKDDSGNYTIAKATATSNTGDGFTSVNTKIGTSTTSASVDIGSAAAFTTRGDITATDTQNTVDNTFSYTKYKFMGWYSNNGALTTLSGTNTSWASTSSSYSPTVASDTKTHWYACYKKYYVFCAYNSYDHEKGRQNIIDFIAAPPTQYKNGSAAYTAYPSQGKKYAVAAGDHLILKYSALASSDCIDTVYFDNTTDYTTGTPTSANFVTDPPYLGDTSDGAGATFTVDNSAHTVDITMDRNLKNITVALGTKWKVFFEDTEGVIINSKNIDNYYIPSESISGGTTATNLSVTAEKSSAQINKITGSSIAIYYATPDGKYATDASGATVSSTPVAVASPYNTITKPTGTSTASASANGTTLNFTGTMPNCNVIIKLNTTVTYNLYLGSKCVADATNTADAMGDVANVYLKNGTTTVYTAGGTPTTVYGPNAVTKGDSRTYNYTWKSGYSSYYMFIGWYKGTSTGPDYTNGFITDKDTLNYTPREHTYIWAVCTRDLFINGSKEITGASQNWNSGSSYKNFKMKFDADYVNPDGGAQGRYYWEITPTIFNAATNKKYTVSTYYKGGDNNYYMNSTNYSSPGNSFFQFFDVEENDSNQSVWKGITSFENNSHAGVHFGKIYPENDSYDYKQQHGYGWIDFSESGYAGYSAPLYIYYYPGKGFSVEATYVPVNIYLSHGYAVGSTTRNADASSGSYLSTLKWMNGTTESSTNITGPINSGWTPNHEGHVNHYSVGKKEATVRVKKDCASTEQVTAFFVYDLYLNNVHAITDVKSTSNTYYADFTTQVGHDLYIVPIIEVKTADMTVYFDASQLNTDRWGKIVTCYAWYSDYTPACGAFPGQPMVPSDDGNSWVAKFPSTKPGDSSKKIAGITFSNYIDGANGTGHSWLGFSNVLDSVTYTNEGADNQTYTLSGDKIVHLYNAIGGTDTTKKYEKVNCKVQTYDYREPISYYTNSLSDGSDDITLTFAIKMGNSDDLMSMKHSELKQTSSNLFTNMAHTNSSGTSEPKTFTAGKNFEYLTNAKGDTYKDLNGNDINGKPTATYYVLSKGEVVYDGSNLKQVFWSSNRNESRTSLAAGYGSGINTVPTGTGAVDETYPISISSMSYAVQWYVYDASGNYITNMLSAGYADDVSSTDHDNTLIGKRLKDLGYAVDGKAVAICYDKPRALNTDNETGGTKYVNSGTTFDAYRATGQWYRTEQIQPVTVTARVGMMTDSGEVLSENNVDGYGSATAKYDTAKGSTTTKIRNVASPTPLGSEYGYVTTALKDAENQPVRLTASESNFIGWYYYDTGTGKFTKAKYESPTNFYPNYTKDIIYYAMYRAAAIYKYKYQGREGDDYFTVGGGDLTSSELATNKVDRTQTIRKAGGEYDISALAPGASNVSVFKKTLNFGGLTSYDNNTLYTLIISTATKTPASYTLTYYSPNSKGGSIASHSVSKTYGSTIDLSSANADAYAPDNQVFMGWYEYNPSTSTYGNLLTTQANYGFVMVKDMTVAAKYGSAAATDSGWKAYIDDNGVTKEMTSSSSGRYYNDTIVRFRNGIDASASVPNNSEVGVIIIDNGGSGAVGTPSTTVLSNYANVLGNNERGKVGSTGKTATKLCKTVTADTLTYYNRYDFALKSDYAAQNGHQYSVYAYVKIGSTYYWSDVASGAYT